MKLIRVYVLMIAFFIMLGSTISIAQVSQKMKGRQSSSGNSFLKTQWWVGIRMGGNFTKAKPTDRFSTFSSSLDPNTNVYDKDYQDFNKAGGHAGIEITYYNQGFSFSFQPSYQRMSFRYTNEYTWADAGTNNSYISKYESIQKLDYFELPISVRYEPFKTKLRPFVQAGVYYAFLNNAYKSTEIKITDKASGGQNEYIESNITVGAKDLFIKSQLGWLAGAGVSYPVGNVRLKLDAIYRRNTNNITCAANRYSNDRLTGAGDILDNMKLRNIAVSLSILIPLRFISKGSFKAE